MPPKKTVKPKTAKRTAAPKAVPVKKVIPSEPAPARAAPIPAHPAAEEAGAGTDRYWEAVGRRKTAIARVRLFTKGDKSISVNGKSIADYFLTPTLRQRATEALDLMNSGDRFRVTALINGGGVNAQAEAMRHGTARALIRFNADFRKRLKRAGYLTRDPRMKERKKFGLKGARRAPQWAKR